MWSKIEKLMKKRNVTVKQLSICTEIGISTLNEWKNGKYKPGIDSLQKLAIFFDVPISYFLED